jgi:DNA-binding NarL/FixJ family response regulator
MTSQPAPGPVSVGRERAESLSAAPPGNVTVSVITDDPLGGDAVRSYLNTTPGIRPVPDSDPYSADVVLVVTAILTEALLGTMIKFSDAAANPRQCMVLIAGPLPERQMVLAFRCGVVSIVPRNTATRETVTQAILASGHGSAVLAGQNVRWLAEKGRAFETSARTLHGVMPGGLTTREVEVVKLLAEGLSTMEIARQLNYAERTIKNIIRDMLSRLGLRNRVQAVAYAYRHGAI